MQVKTFGDLKAILNTFSEEQLAQPLVIEVVELANKPTVHAGVYNEDVLCHIIDKDDFGPRSYYEGEGFDEDEYIVMNKKGDPFMTCDN